MFPVLYETTNWFPGPTQLPVSRDRTLEALLLASLASDSDFCTSGSALEAQFARLAC